jgi:chromosome segregation ATPase
MDQSGNNNHVLLRASPSGLPGYNGQHAAADRMRELLARTVQDHLFDGQATVNALDEIRRRLDVLERAFDQFRDINGLDGGVRAALGPHPGQSLAGIAATLDGLAASLSGIDARVGALDNRLERLDNRLERLDERLDDQYDRVSQVNDSIAASDNRVAALGEQFTGAIAPLTGEVRRRPDRAEIEEIVSAITEAGQRDVIARLASLEEIVLTLAEALLRPAIRS